MKLSVRHFYFTVIFTLLFSFSNAQIIDFDDMAIAKDTVQDTAVWNAYIGLSFDMIKQDQPLLYTRLESSLSYEKKKHLWILTGNNKTTLNGGEQVQNTGLLRFKYLWNFRKKLFPSLFTQMQYDAQRGLRQRNLIGVNGVYTAINKPRHQFLLKLGVMYEEELWDYTAVPDDRIPETHSKTEWNQLIKFNFNPRYNYKINDHSWVSVILFIQGRIDSFAVTPRISQIGKLNLALSDHLIFSSGFYGIYDFKPIVPIDNFYYSWTNTLAWRF